MKSVARAAGPMRRQGCTLYSQSVGVQRRTASGCGAPDRNGRVSGKRRRRLGLPSDGSRRWLSRSADVAAVAAHSAEKSNPHFR